jgi:D-alanyl-D-alanine carboxypeptidase
MPSVRSCPRFACLAACSVAVLSAAACEDGGVAQPTTGSSPTSSPGDGWQQLVDETVAASAGVPGVAVAVLAPDRDVDVAVAAGRPGADDLEADQPFRIASNTKTYTAAATLRLVEQGRLSLDDTLADRADPELVTLLDADGYDVDAITVGHLLQHTSGLYDYASDVDFQTVVLGDPDGHWSRVDQVRFAMEEGDPLAPPGAQFAYSDTGYIVLGDIIERVTGSTLGAALRELLDYDRLGLDATWLEEQEAPPADVPARAHQFYETQDMTDADPSADLYGGGGLVADVRDLARFYEALLGGEVFDEPATLTTMTSVPAAGDPFGAAMGLFRLDHPQLGTCWTHSGFWGTFAMACPDVAIAVSWFQANPDPPFDGDALLAAIVARVT